MISPQISITLSEESLKHLEELRKYPQRLRSSIIQAHDRANQLVLGRVKVTRLSVSGANSLGVRSGRLRSSLRATAATVTGNTVRSAIGTNVVYAGIHEVGGTTRPHIIRPRNGKFLRFQMGGRTVFARSVKHPGSKMPARHWLKGGIEENAQIYNTEFEKSITAAWNAGQTT